MPRVEQSLEASQDLISIARTIAADNRSAAHSWLQSMEKRFQLLATQPLMGEQVVLQLSPDLRRSSVGNYVIYYRPLPDGVEIYRVLHGARDDFQ